MDGNLEGDNKTYKAENATVRKRGKVIVIKLVGMLLYETET